MREWGQQQLLRIHQWLRVLEWTGLHDGCLAIPGDAASILAFPHIASHFFVQMIVEPLIAMSALPGGSVLVSKELVSTIELAWSSARLIYPESVGCDAAFIWCTGMAVIEERLRELEGLVPGAGAEGSTGAGARKRAGAGSDAAYSAGGEASLVAAVEASNKRQRLE